MISWNLFRRSWTRLKEGSLENPGCTVSAISKCLGYGQTKIDWLFRTATKYGPIQEDNRRTKTLKSNKAEKEVDNTLTLACDLVKIKKEIFGKLSFLPHLNARQYLRLFNNSLWIKIN